MSANRKKKKMHESISNAPSENKTRFIANRLGLRAYQGGTSKGIMAVVRVDVVPQISHPDLGQQSLATAACQACSWREGAKASRPLIRVLVINDNGLWINNFIQDNEHRLIHG